MIGAGGVGGFFGGRLVQAGVDVTFVARGAHLAALNATGLHVRSVRGDFTVPVRATEDPASSGTADYVLVAVKSFDTGRVASMLAPAVGDRTAVVSLQNGVDNEERLAAVLGDERVVGGAAYIFATLAEPGVVDHTGGPASVVLGEWRGGTSQRVTNSDPSHGYVKYRFGNLNKIDIEYPDKDVTPINVFRMTDASEGSMNGLHLKFIKNGYTYVVASSVTWRIICWLI